MSKRTRAAGLVAVVVLTAGLAACGDDDDPAVDASPSASEADAGDDENGGEENGAEGDLATYCDKTFEIETIGEPDIDFESASEEEVTAAVKEFATTMQPIAADIQDAAPAEIREDIDVLVAAVDELAETGDFETAFGGEVEEVSNRTHAFDIESCDWNVVDVSATNYRFEGIPDSVEAGKTSFELSNDGTELHELVLLRKKDDTAETFDELLAQPEDQAQAKVDFVASAFGEPGEEGVYAIADLVPGDYMAICFIPVGTTSEDAEPQGPPHFTQGMKTAFTVS